MKITICGSVKFADKFVEAHEKLKALGHEPMMHELMFSIADGSARAIMDRVNEDHGKLKREQGFIKWWHDCIKNSNAVLVLNYDKNGVKNYIGGNTLMEMGFAHVNDKKIFLLNAVPEDVSYKDEIKAMVDEVLNGDLTKIC
ncbi:MAG: hypothetical protein Q7R92_03805 [bacterium]|nr:hypothetical protein [bacterium]